MRKSVILLVDAIVNIIIGCILVLYPLGTGAILGIPSVEGLFYPVILGAVLLGIGIALLAERSRKSPELVGLGTGGAIIINFCAGMALLVFLILGNLNIPVRGYIILWILVIIVFGIGFFELLVNPERFQSPG